MTRRIFERMLSLVWLTMAAALSLVAGRAEASPSPSIAPFTSLGAPRPVVAVGRSYILNMNVASARFWPRNASDSNGAPLTTQAIDKNLAADVFADRIQDLDSTPPPHDPNDDPSQELPACTKTGLGDQNLAADVGCAWATYDSDAYYDDTSGHFFIMAKTRRNVGPCDINSDSPGTTGWASAAIKSTTVTIQSGDYKGLYANICHPTTQAYQDNALPRYIMVAVSKCNEWGYDCENPANGFNTYVLAGKYGDWSQVMVDRNWVMVDYLGAQNGYVWVFSTSALIQGSPARWLPAPLAAFGPSDFSKVGVDLEGVPVPNLLANEIMFVKQPRDVADMPIIGDAADTPLMVTLTSNNQLAVYGMVNLQITSPRIVPLPTPLRGDMYVAATYAEGYLYYAFHAVDPSVGNTYIRTFRWPVGFQPSGSVAAPWVSNDPQYGYLEADLGLGDTGTSYALPVMNVAPNGDFLTMYQDYQTSIVGGKSVYAVQSRYAVVPAGATAYSSSYQIAPASGTDPWIPGGGGHPDILSVASDPLHPEQLFMTSLSSQNNGFAAWITAVRP